jgi:hypothetical protein
MSNPLQPSNRALYPNPQTTMPMPAPSGMPVAYYESTKVRLTWNLQADGSYMAKWSTPVFNLRPDLRSAGGSPKSGVPIWSSSARLYLQISNLVNSDVNTTTGLRVESLESGAIAYGDIRNGYSSVERVTAASDITADFMLGTNQPDRVILTFAPLGESTPVRFWGLELRFRKDAGDWNANQLIYIESAYY